MAGAYLAPFLAGTRAGEEEAQQGRQFRQQYTLQDLLARRRREEQEAGFAHATTMQGSQQEFQRGQQARQQDFTAQQNRLGREHQTDTQTQKFGQDVALEGVKAAYAPPVARDPLTQELVSRTGEVIRPVAPPAPIPPVPSGQQRTTSYDPHGRASYRDSEKPEGQSERVIDEYLTSRGFKKGTPEYARQALVLFKQVTAPEGARIFSPEALLNNNTQSPAQPLLEGPQKPVGQDVAIQVASAEASRNAIGNIRTALRDPIVQEYLGPYDQYRSDVKRRMPMGLAGDVPGSVVDLEQNVALLQNRTIKLITGAQMSEPEAQRIKSEGVDTKYRGPEFLRRLETTEKNNAILESKVKELALRGNPQAQQVAKELGIDVRAPLRDNPVPEGGRQIRVRDKNNPNKTGTLTLGKGEKIPGNLEEIK